MTAQQRRGWMMGAAALTVGVAIGAGTMRLWSPRSPTTSMVTGTGAPAPAAGAPRDEVAASAVTLGDEALTRAGVQTVAAVRGTVTSAVRVPGRVEPNAYKQVAVVSVTDGRVTTVAAALGDVVKAGAILAEVHSPEVAEQQREYLSMRAELEAAHARLTRTERLVAIGSVSRQELETAEVEHTTHASDVESARARLLLLGVSPARLERLTSASEIFATVDVVSPLAGEVIQRQVNPGQNIAPGAALFTVADLSSVWVVGDVYERDAGQVRVGDTVQVTSPSSSGRAWTGRVAYVDPQLNTESRTVRVRVEVPNADRALRLGMYMELAIRGPADAAAATVAIPRTAVQAVGDRQVVYVADPRTRGRFEERAIRVASTTGDQVLVAAGVQPGERVVTTGSFFLRSERERQGLPLPAMPSEAGPASTGAAPVAAPTQGSTPAAPAPGRPVLTMKVTPAGFEPARLTVRAGVAFDLRITRVTEETCATEVVIPSLNIRRPLPLNQAVSIQVPAQPAGELAFACGMAMLKGTVVVTP